MDEICCCRQGLTDNLSPVPVNAVPTEADRNYPGIWQAEVDPMFLSIDF